MTKARVKTPKVEDKPIKEIREERDTETVNTLLKNGWEVQFAGVSHVDHGGFNAKPIYILVKR